MSKFEGVADTLYIPLTARICVSEHFPEYFRDDNGQSVAAKCGMKLIEERPFFSAARKQLKRKLKLYTRIAMKVVDEGARRGFLTHLRG